MLLVNKHKVPSLSKPATVVACKVEDIFVDIVKPFCKKHKVASWPQKSDEEQYELYLWATAAVSAYSFTLGDDKIQAMVSSACFASSLDAVL